MNRFVLMQASNGYSIAIAVEGDEADVLWGEIERAGEPWPSMFRALWIHRRHAETALATVRDKFALERCGALCSGVGAPCVREKGHPSEPHRDENGCTWGMTREERGVPPHPLVARLREED